MQRSILIAASAGMLFVLLVLSLFAVNAAPAPSVVRRHRLSSRTDV
jgi:hypothetical protein